MYDWLKSDIHPIVLTISSAKLNLKVDFELVQRDVYKYSMGDENQNKL